MKNKSKTNKPQKIRSNVVLFKPQEDAYVTPGEVMNVIQKKYPHVLGKKQNRQPFNELVVLLLRWRLTSGLSQAQVASRASVALSTYQLMEEGRPSANPGLKTIWKVARVYGVESLKEFWAGPGYQILTT